MLLHESPLESQFLHREGLTSGAGFPCVGQSVHPDRIRDNYESTFGVHLDPEDVAEISSIAHQERYVNPLKYVHVLVPRIVDSSILLLCSGPACRETDSGQSLGHPSVFTHSFWKLDLFSPEFDCGED